MEFLIILTPLPPMTNIKKYPGDSAIYLKISKDSMAQKVW